MRMAAMLRVTVAASILVGALAIAAGTVLGHASAGAGLAAGLAIGSTNGYLMVAMLNRRVPFAASGFFRMALLTGTALLAAILLHAAPWAVALGVAAAQLVMTGAAVREGLRR